MEIDKKYWSDLLEEEARKIWITFRDCEGETTQEKFKFLVDRSPLKKSIHGKSKMLYEWSFERDGKEIQLHVTPTHFSCGVTFLILVGNRGKSIAANLPDVFSENEEWFVRTLKNEMLELILRGDKDEEEMRRYQEGEMDSHTKQVHLAREKCSRILTRRKMEADIFQKQKEAVVQLHEIIDKSINFKIKEAESFAAMLGPCTCEKEDHTLDGKCATNRKNHLEKATEYRHESCQLDSELNKLTCMLDGLVKERSELSDGTSEKVSDLIGGIRNYVDQKNEAENASDDDVH